MDTSAGLLVAGAVGAAVGALLTFLWGFSERRQREQPTEPPPLVPRRHTRAGRDPLDEVAWTRRDAVIRDAAGGEVFRQDGVEVPAAWSQTATNVTAAKYLRAAHGGAARETSVRQLMGRVVDTLTGFTLPYRLAVSPDGKTAIACDPEGDAIHIIDVASRTSWKLDGLQAPRGVIFAGDNKTAFVTLAGGPSVGVVDLASRKLMRTIGVGQSPDGVGYGPTP